MQAGDAIGNSSMLCRIPWCGWNPRGVILDFEGPWIPRSLVSIRTSVGQKPSGHLSFGTFLSVADPSFAHSRPDRPRFLPQDPFRLGARDCDVLLFPSESDELVAIVRDVTERKRHEERILQQASMDAVTGFSNAVRVHGSARRGAGTAARDGRPAALLLVDLNRFQRINEDLVTARGPAPQAGGRPHSPMHSQRGWQGAVSRATIRKKLGRIGADQFAHSAGAHHAPRRLHARRPPDSGCDGAPVIVRERKCS